jgi:hypothetical protein
MSIFGKQRNQDHGPSMTIRRMTPDPSTRRPHHPPSTSPEVALQRIHTAAEEARAEIASLVAEELKRLEETEVKLRTDLKEVVRAEVTAELDKRRASRSKSKAARAKKS